MNPHDAAIELTWRKVDNTDHREPEFPAVYRVDDETGTFLIFRDRIGEGGFYVLVDWAKGWNLETGVGILCRNRAITMCKNRATSLVRAVRRCSGKD